MGGGFLTNPNDHAVDYGLAAWGGLIFLKVLPAVTAVLAIVLLVIRIGIGVMEWKLKRRELRK